MKVNILGTEYTIIEQTEKQNPKMADNYGLCEQYAKKIIVYPLNLIKNEKDVVDIDWIAIQFPKMLKVFEELGVIE